MSYSKSLLAAAVIGLTALPAAALEVKVGGQINRAVMFVEDGYAQGNLGEGSKTEIYHIDNRNSPTRLNIGAVQRLYQGWTAGSVIEIGAFSNASNEVDPNNKTVDPRLDLRITDLFVDSPYGKLTVGRGEGAAYNAGRRDYSGTGVISFRNPGLIGGSLRYRLRDSSFSQNFDADGNFEGNVNWKEDGNVPQPGRNSASIAGTMRDFNFEGRHERIRYDSPLIGPVTLSASVGHESSNDSDRHNTIMQVGLRSGLRAPGGRLLLGLGYSRATRNGDVSGQAFDPDPDVNANIRTYGGSVSYFHSNTGLNISLAAVNQAADIPSDTANNNFTANDSELAKFRYVKLGYRPSRQHAFDIHYGETLDRIRENEKATVIGAGYVWSPTQMLDLYSGAKIHSFRREWCTGSGRTCYNPKYDDISVVTTGIRMKF
ncbi:MAG: porin [Halomonadaceae bacterium]|nr:MAG: porin [Halomonadaceae bacterium]